MDEGRSFIINLGNIDGHETRKLVGAMLMVQLEQAALSRTDMPPSQRTPCTLLVDEWASFAAEEKTIATVLSQARKFNLRMWLAAQSLSQISSGRLSGALENCRITIAFGLGRESAEIQSRQIAQVDPFAIKEEALTAGQHTQYLSVAEQFETWNQELQNLSPQIAYVKLHDRPAVKIKTLNVPDAKVDPEELSGVLETYKARYQRTQAEADEAIAALSQPDSASVPTPTTGTTTPAYTTLFRRQQAKSSN